MKRLINNIHKMSLQRNIKVKALILIFLAVIGIIILKKASDAIKAELEEKYVEDEPWDFDFDITGCGEICSYEAKTAKTESKYYPFLTKNVHCVSIMTRMSRNPAIPPIPPRRIPEEMFREFTQNGELPVKRYWYLNDVKSAQENFTKKQVEQLITDDKNGKIIGVYETPEPKQAISAYVNAIKDKRGVVIGSIDPWLEALALSVGAKHVTTLEYNNNLFLHPNITKIHPFDMARNYLNGRFQVFDFALSYSSIEHSGLGRYGDPLNPYGDLEAVAQVWCMLKPGGLFLLGLPETYGEDSHMEFNAHRVYGKSRLKHLTANFHVLDHFSSRGIQGLWVLKKTE